MSNPNVTAKTEYVRVKSRDLVDFLIERQWSQSENNNKFVFVRYSLFFVTPRCKKRQKLYYETMDLECFVNCSKTTTTMSNPG